MVKIIDKINAVKKSFRHSYIIAAGVILLLITSALVFVLHTQESQSDPVSEKIIREAAAKQLGKDTNELTNEDIAQITSLILRDIELRDITFLGKFTNLELLILGDISFPKKELPLLMRYLSKLGIIKLNKRFALDISPLENLNHLHDLRIAYMHVKSIEPISKMKNLKSLLLNTTNPSDLNLINNLTNLQDLRLTGTYISDLEPIRELVNLHTLLLEQTRVSDLEPLKKLKNLKTLVIRSSPVSNLEPLKELSYLETLIIQYTPVNNLIPLTKLTNLKILNLDNVQIPDCEDIKNLTSLEELHLIGKQFINLEPLKNLTNLKLLDIVGCENIDSKSLIILEKTLPNLKIYRGMMSPTDKNKIPIRNTK